MRRYRDHRNLECVTWDCESYNTRADDIRSTTKSYIEVYDVGCDTPTIFVVLNTDEYVIDNTVVSMKEYFRQINEHIKRAEDHVENLKKMFKV